MTPLSLHTISCEAVTIELEKSIQTLSPISCTEHDWSPFFQIISVQEHTRTIIIKLCVEEANNVAIRRTVQQIINKYHPGYNTFGA